MRHRANPRFGCATDNSPTMCASWLTSLTNSCYAIRSTPACTSRGWAAFGPARVGLHYRALAVEHENAMVWFWIGSHAVLQPARERQIEKLILRRSTMALYEWPTIVPRHFEWHFGGLRSIPPGGVPATFHSPTLRQLQLRQSVPVPGFCAMLHVI